MTWIIEKWQLKSHDGIGKRYKVKTNGLIKKKWKKNEKMTEMDDRNKHRKLNDRKIQKKMTQKVMTRISNGLIRK